MLRPRRLTRPVGLTELLHLGLCGVLSQGAQHVTDLRHVNLAITLVVKDLERLLEL